MKELATFRCGNVLAIENADSFFTELAERVMALSSLEGNHPLSKDIAVERLKRYIVKSEKIILPHFQNGASPTKDTTSRNTTIIRLDFSHFPCHPKVSEIGEVAFLEYYNKKVTD